jgi:hypothetical protein
MTKQITILLWMVLFIQKAIYCQGNLKQPDGGGNYTKLIQIKDDIHPEARAEIVRMLRQNESRLRRQGKLNSPENPAVTAFSWPIKQAPGYNDNGYYGISNYVDENPAYPNAILDYNCGNRTYDQASGYNHAGTDIFTWPFPWQKMDRNIVQIIAAAPGTIIAKSDGNFDQNCAFCSSACNWNSVYIMHADGSVAWYGHMKSGSLTTKSIGQTVSQGEYLGIVGSSGNSTGPHLHFEVYTNSSYTQLVDPWAGACNNFNGLTSWWASQQPYYVSTLNKVMMHSAAPGTGSCPAAEIPNEKINYANGEILYMGSYYRDQLTGQQSIHRLYKPDNSLYTSWTQNFTTNYNASWWYYTLTLPNPATTGTWKYEITYNGTQKQFAYFAVNSSYVVICPDNYNILTSNLSGSTYQWQVNTGTGYININDNVNYAGTATQKLQLKNLPSSFYGYKYRCLVNGSSFSNEITIKFISYWTGSLSKSWEDPGNWSCGNIPDANTDVVVQSSTNTPEVGSNAFCRSTTVNPGTVITVKAGFKLNIMH